MMADSASIAAGIHKFEKSGTENYLSRRLEKMKNPPRGRDPGYSVRTSP